MPVPGIKLGLANIITVYAVYRYSAAETACMTAVRVFLGAVFCGNMSALIYSAAGAALCLAAMLIMKKILDEKHIWLCSIIGAVFHNIGQLIAAVIVMGTLSVAAYFPILVLSGCIAGFFTGICAQTVISRLGRKMK